MKEHRPSCDCYECSREYDHKHHEDKVVLSCGTGSGVSLPVNNVVATWQPNLVVGTVVLDTRGLKKPTVKIDYSSVITFRTIGVLFDIDILFQLSRSCAHGEKIPLATWTYEREAVYNFNDAVEILQVLSQISIEFKDPVAFTWCDCHDCAGCCTYIVEIIAANFVDIASASITNVGINALAVSD